LQPSYGRPFEYRRIGKSFGVPKKRPFDEKPERCRELIRFLGIGPDRRCRLTDCCHALDLTKVLWMVPKFRVIVTSVRLQCCLFVPGWPIAGDRPLTHNVRQSEVANGQTTRAARVRQRFRWHSTQLRANEKAAGQPDAARQFPRVPAVLNIYLERALHVRRNNSFRQT
jgi:hypothetical protein